jgi:uncharacterized protein (DUF2252 family)
MTSAIDARDIGRALRRERAPDWMCDWEPDAERDPKALLDLAAAGRDVALVKRRNDAMGESAPNLLRGAAGVMASDLAAALGRTTGIRLEICGDAHVGNFGMYASPERRRVFDLTDFDEARPGPWEWDLCRLATSVVVTARDRKVEPDDQQAAAQAAVAAYTTAVERLSRCTLVDRWYALTHTKALEPADLGVADNDDHGEEAIGRVRALLDGADDDDQATTVQKLVTNGRFNADPKAGEDRQTPLDGDDAQATSVEQAFLTYRGTLSDALGRLLEGYTPQAVALRPVGEGSLGLRNYLLLVCGRDPDDALVLQVKEATPSLLTPVLDAYPSEQEGQRVVVMQRALQAVSDPLLGWTDIDGQAFYVRQFRDRKGTPELVPRKHQATGDYVHDLAAFARLCGVTLARAHARAADPTQGQLTQISAYIGDGDERKAFRKAVVAFAQTYADVTENDRQNLRDRTGPWTKP